MLEIYVRPIYQKYFVNPIASRWASVPANLITLAGLGTGICILPALYFHGAILGFILLLISGFFDTLDGTLARLQHTTSNKGCVMDILSDRTVEFSIILGLYFMAPQIRGTVCLVLLGSIFLCVSSFLVVGIFSPLSTNELDKPQKSFHYSPGLIERPEAFIFFSFMILFSHYFNLLAWILSFLIFLTAIIRFFQFMKNQESP